MLNNSLPFEGRVDGVDLIKTQAGRFVQNLTRVKSIVAVFRRLNENLQRSEGERRESFHDLLRSAVVLLHATLEDFLRSTAVILLPLSEESALNEVPLIGASSSGQPAKFWLGRLAAHRDKTVLQVLQESVREHLRTTSYNDTTQITNLLKGLRFEVEEVRSTFPKLDELMRRRHQIVHRADRLEPQFDPQEQVEDIVPEQVEEWVSVVQDFAEALLISIYRQSTAVPASND